MKLVIILTKEVTDVDEATVLTAYVRNKLEVHPDVTVNANVSQTIVPIP